MRKALELLQAKYEGVTKAILEPFAEKLDTKATSEEELSALVEGVTVNDLLTTYGDRRATEASVTAVKNYEKKHNLKEGKTITGDVELNEEQNPQQGAKTNTEAPEWAKQLMEENKALAERINQFESRNQFEARKTQLNEITGKLPLTLQKAYTRINVEGLSEDEYNTLKEEVQTEVSTILKEQGAQGAIFGKPMNGTQPKEGKLTEDEIKAITTATTEGVTPPGEGQPF